MGWDSEPETRVFWSQRVSCQLSPLEFSGEEVAWSMQEGLTAGPMDPRPVDVRTMRERTGAVSPGDALHRA